MTKLNAVIVEDTANPVLLETIVKTYCQDVNIIAVAENVKNAVKVIGEVAPQVVFCDIDLPDGNGFDVLDHFRPLPFKVIFISGKQEYAYQAIKFHPVDFILKPVRVNELVYAVNTIIGSEKKEKVRTRIGNVPHKAPYPDKLTLLDPPGYVVIETTEIIMLEARGNFTDIYLTGNRKKTFCRLLREFAGLLESHPEFIRTHRSYLVNIEQVKSCSRQGVIELTGDHTAQLGNSYRNDFMACFHRS